jgi:hypothetical protein
MIIIITVYKLFSWYKYPKGLGLTVAELDISHAALKLEKTKFTMFSDEVHEFLKNKSIQTIVLFGVEVKLNYHYSLWLL